VFFNHAFSQVVFFDQIGSLALASLFEHQPLWAYPQLGAFFSDNQSLALWSSDDEYVAFPAWHGRFQNIHLLSKTGLFRQITDFSTLGKPDMFVRLMDWSPDGTKLAFVARSSDDTDTSSLLFVLDLMQQEIRELCVRVADVNWSPDSRYLSVVAMNESFSNQSQLIVIDANSGEKWRVGENREALDIIGWSQVSTNTPR
jgi:Tol biopolymer transport system component